MEEEEARDTDDAEEDVEEDGEVKVQQMATTAEAPSSTSSSSFLIEDILFQRPRVGNSFANFNGHLNGKSYFPLQQASVTSDLPSPSSSLPMPTPVNLGRCLSEYGPLAAYFSPAAAAAAAAVAAAASSGGTSTPSTASPSSPTTSSAVTGGGGAFPGFLPKQSPSFFLTNGAF